MPAKTVKCEKSEKCDGMLGHALHQKKIQVDELNNFSTI